MISCPSDLELRLLAGDELESVIFESIDRHTQECPACRARLESLAWEIPAPSAGGPSDLPETGDLPSIPGFTIEKELGRGAMGVVYLAWQESVGRYVALKVIPAVPGADRRARKRWRNEAKAVSSLRHPNAVALYDVGEADSWLYLVLEYIPGQSLEKRLLGPMRPRDAALLMAAIADAVHHIHQAGLLHLDLKPSNILLDGDPQAAWEKLTPKVADFGLAVFDSNRDSATTTMAGPRGTPSYMAPEQAGTAGAPLEAAADVHAMGAVLYELLTGRPPFQGASPLETIDQVRTQEPVPPRRLNPKIPRDLETIALKSLQKNPQRRYSSADAFAGDLRRCLDGRPISARPVSPIEHAWRWCCRRPAVAALSATLMMTFSVGFLTIALLWRHAEAERSRAEKEWSHAERERGCAEAEHLRAESDSKTARAALAAVLDLGRTGLETKELSRDHLFVRLQGARSRILELAKPEPHDPEIWKLLATVDLIIGRDLDLQGKLVEARPVHAESLLYWEKILQEDPIDRNARHNRWESAVRLARAVEQRGNAEESVRHWEQAVILGQDLLPIMSDGALGTFAECRFSLARLVDRQGDQDRAKTILEANLRMLANVPAKTMTPGLRAWVVTTQLELGQINREFLLREIDHLNPEDWADRVARLLSSTCGTDSMYPCTESEVGYRFIQLRAGEAGLQRHNAKLDSARRTADRIHALAKLMVARYPNQAPAHLGLTEAFSQRAKNAWRVDDRGAIERNWKLALDEARQALRLDPRNARARRDAFEYQRRLNDLLVPQKEAEAQGHSVGSALKAGS